MKLRSNRKINTEETKVVKLAAIETSSKKAVTLNTKEKGTYKYHQLSQCGDSKDASYNILCVVVDASYPHKA